MIVRGLEQSSRSGLALCARQAVAMLCAIAFLVVGFVHDVHHFGGPVATVSVQANFTSSAGDQSDASKKPPIVIEHCHGCSMIAIAVLAAPVDADRVTTDLPVRKLNQNQPHPPVAETPPPIAAI